MPASRELLLSLGVVLQDIFILLKVWHFKPKVFFDHTLASTVKVRNQVYDMPLASENLVHASDIYPLIIKLNVIQKKKN